MKRQPQILIVEDEILVADVLEAMLEDMGCTIAGPAHSLQEALVIAADTEADAAIIDLLLRGESTWPVAEILRQRGIPFALSTGWPEQDLGPEWTDCEKLAKPHQLADLEALMARLLGGETQA